MAIERLILPAIRRRKRLVLPVIKGKRLILTGVEWRILSATMRILRQ